MKPENHIAIDLGAGSGRVILGQFGRETVRLDILHRFPNPVRKSAGHERWDTRALLQGITTGLKKAARANLPIASLGVATWGVDYGLFDQHGRLLESPVCYRDSRTANIMQRVFQQIPRETIYRTTGIQFLPINTIFQIVAQIGTKEWPASAAHLLMMPDIFHYLLSGEMGGEYTNASTTALLNAATKQWDTELFAQLQLPLDVMPELSNPGDRIGELKPALQQETGLTGVKIVAPATHDTASAVVAMPLNEDWAYISSGTWSLIGIETTEPILTDEALAQNFTNEGGAFGTIRFLKNVMGLWLLESCRKQWDAEGQLLSYEELINAMKSLPPFQALLDPDDLRFLNPANMAEEIQHYFQETGQPVLRDQAGLSRAILESLALRYATVLDSLQEVTGRDIRGVHIIGGGSQNDFLNQATANATGLPVTAGPVEATALGNLMVQAIAAGRFATLAEARQYLSSRISLQEYVPENRRAWQQARQTYRAVVEGFR